MNKQGKISLKSTILIPKRNKKIFTSHFLYKRIRIKKKKKTTFHKLSINHKKSKTRSKIYIQIKQR